MCRYDIAFLFYLKPRTQNNIKVIICCLKQVWYAFFLKWNADVFVYILFLLLGDVWKVKKKAHLKVLFAISIFDSLLFL